MAAQDLASPPLLAWAGGELYVGLRGNDRKEVWRLPAAPIRVAGGGTAPSLSGPQACTTAPLELKIQTLAGLAPDPDGDGVLFATEDCVSHLSADGVTGRALMGRVDEARQEPAAGVNRSAGSNGIDATPTVVQDFYRRYRCAGGTEKGGFGCSASSAALLIPAGALLFLALLRRRGRGD